MQPQTGEDSNRFIISPVNTKEKKSHYCLLHVMNCRITEINKTHRKNNISSKITQFEGLMLYVMLSSAGNENYEETKYFSQS